MFSDSRRSRQDKKKKCYVIKTLPQRVLMTSKENVTN